MRRGLLLLSLLWIVSATIAQTRPFVVGSVDKSSPYVGEPILYSLKLYYQGEIGERFVSEPSFVGFGRSRVVFEALAYSETFEGVNYSVLEQRYLLYPLRAGTLTIEPFQIDIAETPFDPAWTVFTDDLSITVLPYPEPIPDDFTNGIGQFTVSADASPKNVQTGDALTWTITISGTGNLEQLLAPTLVLPESWRLFDAEVTYEQDNLRFGRTIFSWRVIVGDYSVSSLPAVSFSYFNPQTEQYESRISAPIPLNIMVVTAQPSEATEIPTVVETEQAILPLLQVDSSAILPARPRQWFWWLWVLPPLFTLLMWGRGQIKNRPIGEPRPSRRARSRALQVLEKQTNQIDYQQANKAYLELSEAVFGYLSNKMGMTITQENLDLIIERLPDKLKSALQRCVDEAMSGQYAPITTDDAKQLQKRIVRVCRAIETVL